MEELELKGYVVSLEGTTFPVTVYWDPKTNRVQYVVEALE